MTWKKIPMALRIAAVVVVALVAARVYVLRRPVEVEVARLETDVDVRVFGLGTQEARIASRLGFEAAGQLVALAADHGDRVKAGAILARLDDGEARARLDKSVAGVAAAEAALAKAEALAQRAVVVADQKRRVDDRRKSLVERQAVSIETAEVAELDAKVAAADSGVATRDVEVARVNLAAARAQATLDRVLVDRMRLVAPFDGVVTGRLRELGAVVNPGEALFSLVDPASVWIQAFVDESRAGDLAEGQPAIVRLRSRVGETFRGRVARVGLENDRVGEERRVWVACLSCPPDFHLGEQAEVEVTTHRIPTALLAPETVLRMTAPAEAMGWVVVDGRLAEARLRLGAHLLDGRVEIVDGVPAGGALVVSRDAGAFRDGRGAHVVGAPEARP
ncbi:MAG: efflux RND transporter periplasmic adaptor subunit [Hyphomicrobiales bacterium]|nr:efflux RND transporter periplasmic adaptor subunit [Hyphomicrobiales bacterium]